MNPILICLFWILSVFDSLDDKLSIRGMQLYMNVSCLFAGKTIAIGKVLKLVPEKD